MALFSRRKPSPSEHEHTTPDEVVEDAAATEAAETESAQPESTESVPEVGISVSSFGGLGAPAPTQRPAAPQAPAQQPAPAGASHTHEHPDQVELPLAPANPPVNRSTIEGLEDNAVLRDALAALPEQPTAEQMLGVVRQIAQGHLFLRVRGNVQKILEAGEDLQLGIVHENDKNYMLVYSSGRALSQAVKLDNDTDTSAFAQPAHVVLQQFLAGDFAGLIIDNASAPARLAVPRDLIQRVMNEAQPGFGLKTLLAGERTDETAAAIAEQIGTGRLWVAIGSAGEVDGEEKFGVAEARTADGRRFLQLFTHPLEIVAMGRKERPSQFDLDGLLAAFPEEGGNLDGVLIDPAGPTAQIPAALVRESLLQAKAAEAEVAEAAEAAAAAASDEADGSDGAASDDRS